MIHYENFELSNGLHVFVHEDSNTQIAVVNILYNVGSRDESESKTGFAHLFEHLMFGGSANIASYDEPLQKVGGENNAFTTPDITNYYLTVPANNLETGFWLESDRMISLSFDAAVLEVQRNVVIEEFKQRYLNQPYGDAWLKLRPLAYKTHTYKWATIGKDISHIQHATMEDVKDFFYRFYTPQNAILVVAGNVKTGEVEKLAKKWFGPIPSGEKYMRKLQPEPPQEGKRTLMHEAVVPLDSIFMAYHMCDRLDDAYYTSDLVSDILGRGKSSRLYDRLVKSEKLFSSVEAYITGSFDPGLLVIHGNLNPGFSLEDGEEAIQNIVSEFLSKGTQNEELEKVKNQAESALIFSEVELLNKAINLAVGAVMGNPDLINEEPEKIRSISEDQLLHTAKKILQPSNCSVLYYKSKSAKTHEN